MVVILTVETVVMVTLMDDGLSNHPCSCERMGVRHAVIIVLGTRGI